MTGRPGDGSYHDPYGEDPYGQDAYGQDPYGREAYTQDVYGQDPYGARGGYEEGSHDGQAYGGHPYGERTDAAAYGRPVPETDPYASPHERPGGNYQAAVDSLSDPLTDPLPPSGTAAGGQREEDVSPWFRPAREPDHETEGAPHPSALYQDGSRQPQPPQYPSPHPSPQPQAHQPSQHPSSPQARQPGVPQPRGQQHPPQRSAPGRGPADAGATVAMPAVGGSPGTGAPGLSEPDPGPGRESTSADGDAEGTKAADERHTVALRRPSEEELGGRAARRRAAAGRGKGRGRRAAGSAPAAPARPMTRLEARRAARAAKDGPVVLLSRAIGEIFITCGVLMLLFVAYQLWWTNILADNYAGGAKDSLTQKWEQNPERKPGTFSPGQGFAIMYIPKLDVVVPVAQGIDKQSVLDNGLVGHYDKESGLPTAMPWDEKGNFGVAGHRNTHGEPFRYINRLVAGDKIIVETADTYYVYEMYSRLPSTSPANTDVLDPVPPQSGFEEPGRYITLTTCTPEFTSKYRLIVWGRMVDERPRSEGKPDALVE